MTKLSGASFPQKQSVGTGLSGSRKVRNNVGAKVADLISIKVDCEVLKASHNSKVHINLKANLCTAWQGLWAWFEQQTSTCWTNWRLLVRETGATVEMKTYAAPNLHDCYAKEKPVRD